MKKQNISLRLRKFFVQCFGLYGFAIILFCYAGERSVFAAGKLSPRTLAAIRSKNRSYRDCRKETLAFLREGKISPKRFKRRLEACKIRNPGAQLYISCKKKALATLSRDAKKLSAEVGSCKRLLAKAAYDPSRTLPTFIHNSKLYFAGIDFNAPIHPRDLKLPHFNCEKVSPVMKAPSKAEFFLVGNQPQLFSGFSNKNYSKLRELLSIPDPIPQRGHFVSGLGKLFAGPGVGDVSLYFPTASCSFTGDRGKHFSGMTLYYLVDAKETALFPYFAIAFFEPKQRASRKENVVKLVSKAMNQGGLAGAQHYKLNPQLDAISHAEIKQFDQEGDPLDLCSKPRKHKLLALIRSRARNANDVEYVLFAHIDQLCRFGDLLSRRFR